MYFSAKEKQKFNDIYCVYVFFDGNAKSLKERGVKQNKSCKKKRARRFFSLF